MGIGIDADIHHDPKLLESLHKVPIKDAIPWKISLVYKEMMKDINNFKEEFIVNIGHGNSIQTVN